jgi:hypothetical protein
MKLPPLLFAALLLLTGLSRPQETFAQASANIPSLDELAGNWQIASNLLSLPALNNSLGSGKAIDDAIGIGFLSFPPLTMTGDTGSLLIDDQAPVLDQTRWFAYQVLRKATAGNLGIETAVRMPYGDRGLLFHIVVTNTGTASRTFDLKINLSAITSQHDHWAWGVPRDKHATERFSVVAQHERWSLLFGDTVDATNPLANCFEFERPPDKLLVQDHSGAAIWHLTLKPGATATINYALAFGWNTENVTLKSTLWAKNFDATFNQVPVDWQKRFDAMFTPHNPHFSGNLPVLITPDAQLRRIYYMSAVSLLSVLRTGFPVAPRVYVSNTPESNCTMMY